MTFPAWLTALLEKILVGFLRGAVEDWRRDRALERKGAADAALKTNKKISELSDDQHRNDAVDRGSASDVARRLHDRLGRSDPNGSE